MDDMFIPLDKTTAEHSPETNRYKPTIIYGSDFTPHLFSGCEFTVPLVTVHTIRSIVSYLLEQIFKKPPVGIAHFVFVKNKVL
jgi:hypothetical protein